MIQKSLEFPVYSRKAKGGLSGAGEKNQKIQSANFARTFEDSVLELFHGEIVQEDSRFSSELTELTKRNLKKIGY